MKITKLEYQKKDPNRVNIFVDDKFATGITADDLLRLGLYKDKEITHEELVKIIDTSDFGKLFNKALNFLSYRPRSEWEIRFKFRTEDKDLLDKVVEKLKSINQINDENFARWFVDQRLTFKPEGKRALRFELKKKGIDDKTIAKVLEENQSSDYELALLALKKKSRIKDREKLQRYLASRGFSWDVINEALAKVPKKEYDIDS